MGLMDWLRRRRKPADRTESLQAVIVEIPLGGAEFGREEQHAQVRALGDRLEDELQSAGAGEFDGDEFGGGACTLFMYGPDADRLFEVIEPVLRQTSLAAGAVVTKRRGGAGAAEDRITL